MFNQDVHSGIHACCITTAGQAVDRQLEPSIREAVASGYRVAVFSNRMGSAPTSEWPSRWMDGVHHELGPDPILCGTGDTLYGQSGALDVEAIIARWCKLHEEARRTGYRGLLAIGELPNRVAESGKLNYEERAQDLFEEPTFSAICVYERTVGEAAFLWRILRFHPWALCSGELIPNPLYDMGGNGEGPDGDRGRLLDLHLQHLQRLGALYRQLRSKGAAPGREVLDAAPEGLVLHRAAQHERRPGERQNEKLTSLGLLAEGTAHVLRNLYMGITGQLDLAEENVPAGSSIAETLLVIRQAADRARQHADRLLTYSAGIASGAEVIDLRRRLPEWLDQEREKCAPGLRFEVRLSEELPSLVADGRHLRALIGHLLDNAREALQRRGTGVWVEVRLEAAPRELPVGYVGTAMALDAALLHLTVDDDGEGLCEDLADRILDPFVSTRAPGRGFGLPLALGLSRVLGGGLSVTPREGGGTRAQVWLPVPEIDEA